MPLRALVSVFLSLLAAGDGTAQDVEVWPFAAYRFWGSIPVEEGRLQLPSSLALGGVVNYRAWDGATVEILYAQQATELQLRRPGSFVTPVSDITVRSLHAGAQYRSRGRWAVPYVIFTVGVTHLDPREASRAQAWGLSGSTGAGVTFPPARPVAVRLEGRLWVTAVGGPDRLFCSSGSGCFVSVSSPLLWQGQLAAGIRFAF
jgi:hypothetical protein